MTLSLELSFRGLSRNINTTPPICPACVFRDRLEIIRVAGVSVLEILALVYKGKRLRRSCGTLDTAHVTPVKKRPKNVPLAGIALGSFQNYEVIELWWISIVADFARSDPAPAVAIS